jgi:hypothetical protein
MMRQRWLDSLPEGERAPSNAMLDAFAPDERRAFFRTLRAAPTPEARDAIRRELLALDPAARSRRLAQIAPPPSFPPPPFPPPPPPEH